MLLLLYKGAQNSQSLAATLDDVTVSIAQAAQHTQSLAATLADVTVAAVQTAQHPQSLAITLDGVTVAVSQAVIHSQTLAATLDSVAVAIVQTGTKSQALAITLDGVTAAIVQASTKSQALAITLDGIAFAAVQVASHPAGGIGHKRKFAVQIGGRLELFENEQDRDRWLADQKAPTAAKTPVVVPKLVAVHTVPNGLGKRLEAARGIVARMPALYVPPIDLRSIDVDADLRRWLAETDDEEALLMLMA